jgi:hypothetical protein
VRDLGKVIEMQDGELKPSGEQRRTRARAERDLLDLVDLDLLCSRRRASSVARSSARR